MLVAIIFKIVIMSLEYLKNFPDLSIHVILLHQVEISLKDYLNNDLKVARDANLIFSVICFSPFGYKILN